MRTTSLTLISVGDEPDQFVVDRKAAVGNGDPGRRQRLTRLEAGAAAQRPGKVHRVLGDRHRALQPLVAVRRQLGRRPVRQVDAVGGVRRDGGDEVVVERFGEERQDRGEHPGRRHEGLVQRRERGVLVARIVRPREPPA